MACFEIVSKNLERKPVCALAPGSTNLLNGFSAMACPIAVFKSAMNANWKSMSARVPRLPWLPDK